MEGRETKWLNIRLAPKDRPDAKTEKYRVCTKDGTFLGEVKWFGQWRKYSFFPTECTAYESTCMRDIAQFMDDMMAERRAKKNGNEHDPLCDLCANHFANCEACKKDRGRA